LFAAQSWALWLIRNKLSIEKSFPKQPADCFFKTAIFLQLWRPLLKAKHVDKLDVMVGALRSCIVKQGISLNKDNLQLPD
jgi:hypothetical protein